MKVELEKHFNSDMSVPVPIAKTHMNSNLPLQAIASENSTDGKNGDKEKTNNRSSDKNSSVTTHVTMASKSSAVIDIESGKLEDAGRGPYTPVPCTYFDLGHFSKFWQFIILSGSVFFFYLVS